MKVGIFLWEGGEKGNRESKPDKSTEVCVLFPRKKKEPHIISRNIARKKKNNIKKKKKSF
jgi:hypothetical protein